MVRDLRGLFLAQVRQQNARGIAAIQLRISPYERPVADLIPVEPDGVARLHRGCGARLIGEDADKDAVFQDRERCDPDHLGPLIGRWNGDLQGGFVRFAVPVSLKTFDKNLSRCRRAAASASCIAM